MLELCGKSWNFDKCSNLILIKFLIFPFQRRKIVRHVSESWKCCTQHKRRSVGGTRKWEKFHQKKLESEYEEGTRKSYQFNSLAKWMKIYFIFLDVFFLTLTSFFVSLNELFNILATSSRSVPHPLCKLYNEGRRNSMTMNENCKEKSSALWRRENFLVYLMCLWNVECCSSWGWRALGVKWWIHLSKHEKNNGFRIYSISNFLSALLPSLAHEELHLFSSTLFFLLASRCYGFLQKDFSQLCTFSIVRTRMQ